MRLFGLKPIVVFTTVSGKLMRNWRYQFMDPAVLSSLARAIKVQEGWFPGSLSYRNNNPGNLRYVGQAGATRDVSGFAVFPSADAGMQALEAQIALDVTRGYDAAGRPVNTLGDLISSWAPPSENDTASYISSVVAQTGIAADQTLQDAGAGVGDASGSSFADDFTGGGSFAPTAVAVIGGASLLGAYFLFFR